MVRFFLPVKCHFQCSPEIHTILINITVYERAKVFTMSIDNAKRFFSEKGLAVIATTATTIIGGAISVCCTIFIDHNIDKIDHKLKLAEIQNSNLSQTISRVRQDQYQLQDKLTVQQNQISALKNYLTEILNNPNIMRSDEIDHIKNRISALDREMQTIRKFANSTIRASNK